jgi:ATP-dependent helicase/nuclease subunit B
MEMSQFAQAKYVFVLGLHDQNLPQTFENSTLLTDEERNLIKSFLSPLAASSLKDMTRLNNNEKYLAYRLFLSARKKLYLSFPEQIEGESRQISPYLRQIVNDLKLKVTRFALPDLKKANSSQLLNNIGTFRMLLSDLVLIFQEAQNQRIEPHDFWKYLYKLLLKSNWSELTKRVFSRIDQKNLPTNLSKETASKLYGSEIIASVSSFETFYTCEYRYFLATGLKLTKREVPKLTSALAGNFYHEALDLFFKELQKRQLSLAKITKNQFELIAQEVWKRIDLHPQFKILPKNSKINYFFEELKATVRASLQALQIQNQRADFCQQGTEFVFADQTTELILPLSTGGRVFIRGKIDRIDYLGNRVAVIDYKSSAHKFDLTRVYQGLSLQLVTYLDVAQRLSQRAPGGSFYFHVYRPKLKYQGEDSDQFAQLLLAQYQLNGFFLDQVVDNLDRTLSPGEKSLVFPLKLKKDGLLDANSLNYSYLDSEWEVLKKFNRQKFIAAGEKIISGEQNFNPVKEKSNQVACQYCPYKSICKFDVLLPENKYHQLEKFSSNQKKIILNKMESEC